MYSLDIKEAAEISSINEAIMKKIVKRVLSNFLCEICHMCI